MSTQTATDRYPNIQTPQILAQRDSQAVIRLQEDYTVTAPTLTTRPHPAARSSKHLTLAELCEELDISRSTFYDWRAKRKAPKCFRLPNGEIRIKRADLERWIETLEDAE
jgi:excisionase family DNA binding protein